MFLSIENIDISISRLVIHYSFSEFLLDFTQVAIRTLKLNLFKYVKDKNFWKTNYGLLLLEIISNISMLNGEYWYICVLIEGIFTCL